MYISAIAGMYTEWRSFIQEINNKKKRDQIPPRTW